MKGLLAAVISALAGAVLVHGCATTRSISGPAAQRRRIVAAKCSSCHLVPGAASLSTAQAGAVLASHASRVRLDPQVAKEIRAYLVRRAGER